MLTCNKSGVRLSGYGKAGQDPSRLATVKPQTFPHAEGVSAGWNSVDRA